MNLDSQLQQVIEELLAHGISLDLAKKEFEEISAARRLLSESIATPFATRWVI